MRSKPYTEKGIKRVPCLRCGEPSKHQWRICSLNKWAGICTACDIKLNKLVLKFMGVEDCEKIMEKYKESIKESEVDK